jgi:hypothetical protein
MSDWENEGWSTDLSLGAANHMVLEWHSGIRPGPLYPQAGAQPGLRSTGAHNNRPWA